jgi:hypothetical protein
MHSSPFTYLVASAPPFVHFTADELRYTAAPMDADNLELKDIVPMASIKKTSKLRQLFHTPISARTRG